MSDTQLGEIVSSHFGSLWHYTPAGGDSEQPWPWMAAFLVAPAGATVGLAWLGLATAHSIAVGLLAAVGVLGGLLFQVLAWVSGRIGTLADAKDPDGMSESEISLVARLDIARSNIAYATLVSLVLVFILGATTVLSKPPGWLSWLSTFGLIHFGLTLLVVLTRINSIGRSDRVLALTRHARHRGR